MRHKGYIPPITEKVTKSQNGPPYKKILLTLKNKKTKHDGQPQLDLYPQQP